MTVNENGTVTITVNIRFNDIAAEVNRNLDEGIDAETFAEWAKDNLGNYADWLRMSLTEDAANKVADIYIDEH